MSCELLCLLFIVFTLIYEPKYCPSPPTWHLTTTSKVRTQIILKLLGKCLHDVRVGWIRN
ncbi:CLUMA_CG007432, isoform A [Clunio marinus]|uniref:CLUMA_CG007432, isoform A n=1 Tax=Clunio marinus TaxID=568069 RepID=A0A1J1I682_9DIPT|nr:CLUMA_CG007432, isoform A [Clunio marinus]